MKQLFCLSILFLLAISFANNSSITLISPIDSKQLYVEQPADFYFTYLNSQLTGETTCVLSIDDTPVATITAPHNSTLKYSSNIIDYGTHTWSVNCNGTISNTQNFEIIPSLMYQNSTPKVRLLSPDNQTILNSTDVDFIFIYESNTQNETASCYLKIGQSTLGPLELPSNTQGVITIEDIPKRGFKWHVVCNDVDSETYSLSYGEPIPPSIEVLSPKVSESLDHNNPQFWFVYNSGDFGPKEATCSLVFYSFATSQAVFGGTTQAFDSTPTKIEASNLEENSTYFWYVECNREDMEYYTTSGDALELFITSNKTKIHNQTNVGNETQNQTQIKTATLFAPTSAFLNDTIILQLYDDNGPIPNVSIRVISSHGDLKYVRTSQNGSATFSLSIPDSYFYDVVGYKLSSEVFTNVLMNNSISNQGSQSTAQDEETDILFYAVPLVSILIMVFAAYLLFGRKPKTPKTAEDDPEPKDSPTQP